MTQHPFWLQFAELFDYVEDVRVWVKDRDGRFSWVNQAFLLDPTNGHQGEQGQDAHGILGQTDYDRSPAFLADQYRLDDEYVLAGNRIVNRVELICHPEPLLAGVPPLLWPDSPRIPRALCPGKGRRSWNKTCRCRAMTDLLWAAILLPSSRPPSPESPKETRPR